MLPRLQAEHVTSSLERKYRIMRTEVDWRSSNLDFVTGYQSQNQHRHPCEILTLIFEKCFVGITLLSALITYLFSI